jgi:hypothetical protein
MRRDDTRAEKIAWIRLRDRRILGLKFRRQVPIDPYIVDFYCHDLGLTNRGIGWNGSRPTGTGEQRSQAKHTSKAAGIQDSTCNKRCRPNRSGLLCSDDSNLSPLTRPCGRPLSRRERGPIESSLKCPNSRGGRSMTASFRYTTSASRTPRSSRNFRNLQ